MKENILLHIAIWFNFKDFFFFFKISNGKQISADVQNNPSQSLKSISVFIHFTVDFSIYPCSVQNSKGSGSWIFIS